MAIFDIGGLHFEWDPKKADINQRKHGVSFWEAISAFSDEYNITIPDPYHSADEDRFLLIGMSAESKLLTVVHVARGIRMRIINARRAAPKERRAYEQESNG